MTSLRTKIRRVRHRLLGIGTAAGIVWGSAAAMLLFLLGAWLDLLWEFSPEWRIVTLWAAGTAGGILLCALAALSVRAARDAALARRIDRAGGAGGRIFTGWELEQGKWGLAPSRKTHDPTARFPARRLSPFPASLSAGLASLAIDDAATAAGQVPLSKAAPIRPLGRSLSAFALLWAVVAMLAVCLPGLAWTQWNRFVRPFDDVPPFSLTEFEVTPGDKDVLYGSELEIRATVVGAPVEQLELVLESANGQEPPLPMFPEPNGAWRAVLAKVVEPADYFVRAYRARSPKYHIGVITVPLVEGARLRIAPPEYAHQAVYDGPMPKEGVCGLPGTKVQVFLRSNRPLGGGTILLNGSGGPATLPMKPTEPGSQEVLGEFSIAGDGKFECRVIDEAGQPSQQSFSGNVTMLADQRPFIRITQPPKMSLATPTATVPVVLSAEDDCGISRLQLFRSLNDSRPLPCDVPLPSRPARRLDEQVRLPLEKFGLEPGDVIKLFGRVEDNDPAGAKGAEGSVVMLRIVSEEEFEKLSRTREGIQAMFSKYDAARRRMEGLAKEVEGLQKKLKKLPPGEKLAEETRQEMQRLQRLMRQEAEAMRQAAKSKLPYDLDKNLTPQLDQLVAMTEEMAKELEKFEKERDLINEKLANKLDRLAERLSGGRKLFDEAATKPLEYFEAVFPLMLDQSRFVMLVQWQKDFAERLAALKGRDGEDDPSLKTRMRDLEQEQRQIREALAKFLDDMQEHIEKLPEKPELQELRATAQEFVKKVRASGASEAMIAAEAALAEFAPTEGHKKAKEAADILEKFLDKCEGVGSSAQGALAFQPRLCNSMGDTMAQLTADMGLGNGNGMMGGYSMVGLFGGLPEMFGGREGEAGDQQVNQAEGIGRHTAKPTGDNPDAARGEEAMAPGAAAGTSEGAIPARYRRQVGQYFQRVAEETGEGGR